VSLLVIFSDRTRRNRIRKTTEPRDTLSSFSSNFDASFSAPCLETPLASTVKSRGAGDLPRKLRTTSLRRQQHTALSSSRVWGGNARHEIFLVYCGEGQGGGGPIADKNDFVGHAFSSRRIVLVANAPIFLGSDS